MAFNNKDFSVMAYANGFTIWNYNTSDALSAVKSEGYFNDTAAFVRGGDMIMIVANNKSAIETSILAIKSVASGIVVIGDFVATSAA